MYFVSGSVTEADGSSADIDGDVTNFRIADHRFAMFSFRFFSWLETWTLRLAGGT
jgi:hypothetical protein